MYDESFCMEVIPFFFVMSFFYIYDICPSVNKTLVVIKKHIGQSLVNYYNKYIRPTYFCSYFQFKLFPDRILLYY